MNKKYIEVYNKSVTYYYSFVQEEKKIKYKRLKL